MNSDSTSSIAGVESTKSDHVELTDEVGTIVYSGWLEKRTELTNEWRKRWMVLYKGGPLFYYDNQKETTASGVINLLNARLVPRVERNGILDPLAFNIRVTNKVFILRAFTMESKNGWIRFIENNITKLNTTIETRGKTSMPASGSLMVSRDEMKKMVQANTKIVRDVHVIKEVQIRDPESEDESVDESESTYTGGEEDSASQRSDTENEKLLTHDNNNRILEVEEEGEEKEEQGSGEGGEVVYEGWISYRGSRKWQEMFAVLERAGPLFIFKPAASEPLCVIPLAEAQVFTHVENKGEEDSLAFNVRCNNTDFVIRALSLDDKANWCRLIADNIQAAITASAQPSAPAPSPTPVPVHGGDKEVRIDVQVLESDDANFVTFKRTSSKKQLVEMMDLNK